MIPKDTTVAFDNFVKEASRLRQKYQDQICLLLGMETEWIHSQTAKEIEDVGKRYELDYVVGSLHHVNFIRRFERLVTRRL
jgi:histidinol-phosphatase (PHP family)